MIKQCSHCAKAFEPDDVVQLFTNDKATSYVGVCEKCYRKLPDVHDPGGKFLGGSHQHEASTRRYGEMYVELPDGEKRIVTIAELIAELQKYPASWRVMFTPQRYEFDEGCCEIHALKEATVSFDEFGQLEVVDSWDSDEVPNAVMLVALE